MATATRTTTTDILTKLSSREVKRYYREKGIEYLALFGSASRGESNPESDVDLLVRFNQSVSLLKLVTIERELSEMIGQPADLVTEAALSPRIRPFIEPDLKTIYEAD